MEKKSTNTRQYGKKLDGAEGGVMMFPRRNDYCKDRDPRYRDDSPRKPQDIESPMRDMMRILRGM